MRLALAIALGAAGGGLLPLVVTGTATANTGDSTTFTGTGGLPPYTYAISTNNSSGFIGSSTGVHVAGPFSGTDTITATDALGQTTTANIVVTAPANLILWPNNATFVAGTVTSLTDRSAIGGSITVNGSPSAAADAQYGNKITIPFDGSTQYMVTATTRTHGPFTMLFVGRLTGTAGQIMHTIGGGTGSSYMFSNTANSINATRGATTSGWNRASNWGIGAVPRTLITKFDGSHAGHLLRINGVEQSMTNANAGEPGTGTITAVVAIMARGDNAGNKSAGTVGDFMFFDRALSNTECQQEEAFHQKWFTHY